jgi:hypothetical protein
MIRTVSLIILNESSVTWLSIRVIRDGYDAPVEQRLYDTLATRRR